jgi:hypothetical protein
MLVLKNGQVNDPTYADVKVDKWQVKVVTSPERKDLPKQKIKLEIANVPAYERTPLALNSNYDFYLMAMKIQSYFVNL